jgi:hypothetical protein
MKQTFKLMGFLVGIGLLFGVSGCSPTESVPQPSPPPAGAKPVSAKDPSVLNNPNVPADVKRQLQGGGPAGAPK